MSEGCCCFSPSAEWPGRTIGLTSEILNNPVTGCTPRFQVFFFLKGRLLEKTVFFFGQSWQWKLLLMFQPAA